MIEKQQRKRRRRLTPIWRAIIEVDFIIFLFYSNLLMGEYTHSGSGHKHGLLWALQDILTVDNLIIAIISALVGHLMFEFLRGKL